MIGLGTIINTSAIIIGGILGLLFGKILNERLQKGLTVACGVSTLFIGIVGIFDDIYVVNSYISDGTIMLLVCLVLGTLIGELINIDKCVSKLGDWLKVKTKSQNDGSFTEGFLTASITFCVGAMTILGPFKDAIFGDYSILLTKSVLDFVMVIVLTSTLGKGSVFACIPVFVIQSIFTLLGYFFVGPVLSASAITNLSVVGSALIFCVGVNLIWKDKIKVANMLPAILVAVLYGYVFA